MAERRSLSSRFASFWAGIRGLAPGRAQFEAELSRSAAIADLHRRVVDSSADCVAVLHADGTVASMNAAGLRLFDLPSPEAAVGRAWPELWRPAAAEAARAITDALWGGEGRFVSRLDSGMWFDVIVTPLRDGEGAPARLVGTARDVTDYHLSQQRLADSELRFRTLADTMPQIVFTASAKGRPDYFNSRWYEYTGAPVPPGPRAPAANGGETAADSWGPHLHAADLDATLAAWALALEEGTTFQVQCRFTRADGAHRWFITRAVPLRDDSGRVMRWIGTCTDVDDQKQADEERSRLLTSERAARADAERAARLKDEFVSTLSHELRTPLNAIAGWIQVLHRDQRADTMDTGLAAIDRNLKRQTLMIEQLLDMSRIASGKMRLEVGRVQLGPVIDEAVNSVQTAADVKGVRIDVESRAPLAVRGDAGRLQQVVWNLLLNAVKFSRQGDTVEVVLRQEQANAVIEVRDVGEGIAPEFLPELFQRFRQADASSTRSHAGLGLGLALVKNLVEMHGGSVHASSDGLEKGATFTVRLPLAPLDLVKGHAVGNGPGRRVRMPDSVQERGGGERASNARG